MIEEYKPNSNRYKEEQKTKEREKEKVEKVISGKAIVKQPSKIGGFLSENARNVASYVVGDVLIPTIKDTISDIVKNTVDIMLFGESRKNSRRSTVDRVSYTNYYDRRSDRPRISEREAIVGHPFKDVIVPTRGEAEDVLDRMEELLDSYGVVSVADLYDLAGVSSAYTDNKFGWTTLRNAKAVRVRDGYLIQMPRAVSLD